MTDARRAVARVDPAAISANVRRLRDAAPGAALCAVVKADGYGHGARTACRAALDGGATWIAVATADEALALRRGGGLRDEARLLVLGAISDAELPAALEARAELGVWDAGFLGRLPDGVRVHVKLDTGMGRLGTRDPREATALARAAGDRLAGLWTHFATADDHDDDGFLQAQLDRFDAWALPLGTEDPRLILHAANSAATLREPRAHHDLVRCGVAVYGLDPFGEDPAVHDLTPALRLTSYVAAVKPCARGESAGYGRRFRAERDTVLATVPIGYGDGVSRANTNDADVVVNGRRFPLVGAVSMDNITLDLGPDGGGVRAGDEAVLLGDGITAEEVAARLGTINYEVTTALLPRARREPAT